MDSDFGLRCAPLVITSLGSTAVSSDDCLRRAGSSVLFRSQPSLVAHHSGPLTLREESEVTVDHIVGVPNLDLHASWSEHRPGIW